jgi:hypothetical protein
MFDIGHVAIQSRLVIVVTIVINIVGVLVVIDGHINVIDVQVIRIIVVVQWL